MQSDMLEGDPLPDDLLEHLDDPEIRHAWPQLLSDLVAVIEHDYRALRLDADQARRLAMVAVRAVSRYAGGRQIYIPVGEQLDRALRDREIWERWRGNNMSELCRDYGLTERQIYDILRRQRALARRRHQRDLPFGEDRA